jgi:hypothetical protein
MDLYPCSRLTALNWRILSGRSLFDFECDDLRDDRTKDAVSKIIHQSPRPGLKFYVVTPANDRGIDVDALRLHEEQRCGV